MDDIYEIIEEYNPNKNREILLYFDDVIANMVSNEKPKPIVNELLSEVECYTFLMFLLQNVIL